MKLCYKVVSQHSNLSPYCPTQVKLKYEVGQVTAPKFGRIFVFKKLKDAVQFANSDLQRLDKILLCECNELIKQDYGIDLYGAEDPELYYRGYWKGNNVAKCTLDFPCYTTKYVKPIREIKAGMSFTDEVYGKVTIEGYNLRLYGISKLGGQ